MKSIHFLNTLRQRSGYTLIELLVVVTIIVLLTSIGLVSYGQISKNSRDGKRKSDLEQVRAALVLYRIDTGTYPATGGLDWSNMSPVGSYISVTSMSDPRGGTYTYTSDTITFSVCATLENTTPATYCVRNP
jgi:prepilin-type N-terminal cleavage/methylation domain-containing protein